jgi:hypothetical protein
MRRKESLSPSKAAARPEAEKLDELMSHQTIEKAFCDKETQIGTLPALFANEESQNRCPPEPRDLWGLESRPAPWAPGSVFQAKMKTRERKQAANRRWSGEVTRKSNAMDLERSVFKKSDPRAIAKSLKRSAERSTRRKSPPFRSAMSMLNFYINRGGTNIPSVQKRVLVRAKDELRKLFQRPTE